MSKAIPKSFEVENKVILVGEKAVGKTSIRRYYIEENFTQNYMVTIGADYAEKTIQYKSVHDDYPLVTAKQNIWDIGGQKSFKAIITRFLTKTNAVIAVYDITKKQTLYDLNIWLDEIASTNKDNNLSLIIVGNKADLSDEREVEETDVKDFVQSIKDNQKYQFKYVRCIETSALTGLNINECFTLVNRSILATMLNDEYWFELEMVER